MDAYAQYRAQAATTASPAQLVLMLYDGALTELSRAERALTEPVDLVDAHDCLTRAQAIVGHLSMTLDHDRGGVIAANLASLYSFCQQQLVEANLRKSSAPLAAVGETLRGLRDAWEAACVQQLTPAVAG
jgi:flagellar protein FliS